jgi:hypothetical protein
MHEPGLRTGVVVAASVCGVTFSIGTAVSAAAVSVDPGVPSLLVTFGPAPGSAMVTLP